MISVNWEQLLGGYSNLAGRYQSLPYHIAKKHLLASMRRAITATGGVRMLRQATPPTNTRRGRRRKGERRSSGDLRRSVTTKAKWIGRNRDGFAVAALGYKYNQDNRKAIWHEFGTTRMQARHMMEMVYERIRNPVARQLSIELAHALDRATAELERNPGMSRRGLRAGVPRR